MHEVFVPKQVRMRREVFARLLADMAGGHPTPAEIEAHVRLSELAARWRRRNTAERVTTALTQGARS